MDISPVFSLLQAGSPDDLRKLFELLRNRMRSLDAALQAYDMAATGKRDDLFSDRILALKKESDFVEWAPLGKISESLPVESRAKFGSFRSEYESTIRQIGTIVASLEFQTQHKIRDQIKTLFEQLDGFEQEATSASSRRRWMTAGCSVLLSVAGATFLFFQFLLGDIEPVSLTLLFPSAPYGGNSVTSNLKLGSQGVSLPDRTEFMTDFTRFYFGHPNDFLDQNYEVLPPRKSSSMTVPGSSVTAASAPALPQAGTPQPVVDAPKPVTNNHPQQAESEQVTVQSVSEMHKERAYRWKILLQNSSMRSPRYVSDVRETIELVEEEPFPWNELRHQPKIKVQIKQEKHLGRGPQLWITNEALGPAVDLNWRIATSTGELIREGTQFHLGGRRIGQAEIAEWKKWGFVKVAKGDKSAGSELLLVDHVYEQVDHLPEGAILSMGSPGGDFIRSGDVYGRRIRTLSDLTKVSGTVCNSIEVRLAYADLAGVESSLKDSFKFADGFYLFKWTDRILPSGAAPAGFAPFALYCALANAYSPLDVNKTARESMTTQFEFDLLNLAPRRRVTNAAQIDANLSPLGHLCVFTTARCVRNGTYQIAVSVNGTEKMKLRVRTLNPELRSFPNKTTATTSGAAPLRFAREQEIRWYRTKIQRDVAMKSQPSLKDELFVVPLDDLRNDQGIDPRTEFPFDPAVPASDVSAPPAVPSPVEAAPAVPRSAAPAPPNEAPKPEP